MTITFIKFTLVLFLILVTIGCSSRSVEEVGCNFSSGSTYSDYDKESSWRDNFISDVLSGLFNVALQGAHRTISSDTYDSCVKKYIATCIDSTGNIKNECMLTK